MPDYAGETLAFDPHQPAGHFVQSLAQCADQLRGLGRITLIHEGNMAPQVF
jgi:hypothetical protein